MSLSNSSRTSSPPPPPRRRGFLKRPWPVESTITTIISLNVASALLSVTKSSHLGDKTSIWTSTKGVAPILTAVSSLITLSIIWTSCARSSTDERGTKKQQQGADAAGVSIGSTLAPLLFCSYSLWHSRNSTTQSILESYALSASLCGFAFALGSLRQAVAVGSARANITERCHSSTIAKTAATILLIAAALIVGANLSNDRALISTVGLQAFLLFFYAKRNRPIVCAAFTPGEWSCVSSILSHFLTDFAFRYMIRPWKRMEMADMHFAVSHGGITGCILGCAIASTIRWRTRDLGPSICGQEIAKLCIIVVVTAIFVEIPVRSGWNGPNDSYFFAPCSLFWLVDFLSSKHTPATLIESSSTLQLFSNISGLKVLSYWALVLLATAPSAGWMASRLMSLPSSPKKRRLVVVSRKYFHLVAVLLFLPPTLLLPSMMVLSYAIALCVLILIETMRHTVVCVRRESNDSESTPLSSLNDFYQAFYDEKDTASIAISKKSNKTPPNVFIITHMAMIFGCAFPLWVHEAMCPFNNGQCSTGTPALFLLPVMGIIVLGVGDAAGAVVGVFFGKNVWPGTKRTIEGSIAMFSSMLLASFIILEGNPAPAFHSNSSLQNLFVCCRLSPIFFILTMIEAFTCQIDNLFLPLVGAALCLVFEKH